MEFVNARRNVGYSLGSYLPKENWQNSNSKYRVKKLKELMEGLSKKK